MTTDTSYRSARSSVPGTPRGFLQIIKYRYWYFLFSGLIIVPGIVFMFAGGLRPGIDFTGGTEIDLQFTRPTTTITDVGINRILIANGLTDNQIQGSSNNEFLIRVKNIGNNTALRVKIEADLSRQFGPVRENSVNSIGPTIGSEIRSRAAWAVIAASIAILLYISWAFRKTGNPFVYGSCAIIAMLHDVLVVLGLFAILGKLFNVTIDSLFITALLTVIGFSVHDTIVIFDRIRENLVRRSGEQFEIVVNNAILQSLARSLNTSLTVLLTLLALLLFGGQSIHIFALTLLIGITSGTYSSIFNASPLLVVWQNGEIGRLFGRRRPTALATAR